MPRPDELDDLMPDDDPLSPDEKAVKSFFVRDRGTSMGGCKQGFKVGAVLGGFKFNSGVGLIGVRAGGFRSAGSDDCSGKKKSKFLMLQPRADSRALVRSVLARYPSPFSLTRTERSFSSRAFGILMETGTTNGLCVTCQNKLLAVNYSFLFCCA